ncbi:MAG TPA: magnesium transporter CorA family protein [Nitrososphaeraceae archaeon]|nr:magnesium transporter CorA family protein [Nitrososphaeraceae archaeon]
MTITSYIIDNTTIRSVNIISEAIFIRDEMRKNTHKYLWVHANEIEDIFPLQDMFGLHPLTVEAVLHENQPSKIDEYARYIFAIIDGIAEIKEENVDKKDEEKLSSMQIIEDDLYMFLERRWIITVNIYNQHFVENIKKKIKAVIQQNVRNNSDLTSFTVEDTSFEKQKKDTLKKNELIFNLALEEMVLTYYPVIDDINLDLEQTEEDILDETSPSDNKRTKSHLSHILLLRKKISFIERTLGMMSQAFQDFVNIKTVVDTKYEQIESSDASGTPSITKDFNSIILLNPESIRKMRSLNDRIIYLRNDIENMHQRVISLRETHNSSLSANLNETIRTLTVIATVVLPLTLITGIYGMNFKFMPELTSPFGYYYALGLIAAIGGGMIYYFKRKRWI